MHFLPSSLRQECEKTSEKCVRWGNSALQNANSYIKEHPVNDKYLNIALIISQVALVTLQLYNALYIATVGLATGAAAQQIVKRISHLPRNLSTIGQTIDDIWSNKIIKVGTCIGGIMLIWFPRVVVAIATSTVTGAYISNKF